MASTTSTCDLYDEYLQSYVNLFLPLGLAIKSKGCLREIEMTTEEIHNVLGKQPLALPVQPLDNVLGFSEPAVLQEKFAYQPGYFTRL
ncbi:hypothetical protein DFAR_390010 [Desulfarculales bacterium]